MADDSDKSVDEMMQHLGDAKELDDSADRKARRNKTGSSLQDKMKRQSDVAVLASNHEARLDEIATNDAVTHRSGKRWKSAQVGVQTQGYLPIYYRLDGQVTHKGYITDIVLDPGENTSDAEEFVQNITDEDTYSDYFDKLDTTTFIVTAGEELTTPFPQSDLRKVSDGTPIEENYSRQPAYVIHRDGDFPGPP